MDFTHLRYFQKIAECGSLTAAARALGVSQPALTVAVRNLEESLSTTLLVRNRNGVTVTATGRALLEHAMDILSRVERARVELSGLQDENVGGFTLGCHESLAAYFVPGFMRSFIALAPRVELNLWNGTSQAVRDAVVRREVEFGLAVNPEPHPDLVVLPLFHDAVDVVAEKSLVHQTVGVLAEAENLVRRSVLIMAPRVAQCTEVLNLLAARGCPPARVMRCGDLELVKSLALAGLGPALLPRRVASYNHRGALLRLHPALPSFPDTIALLFRGDIHRTRAAVLVKDQLITYGRSLDSMADPTLAAFPSLAPAPPDA